MTSFVERMLSDNTRLYKARNLVGTFEGMLRFERSLVAQGIVAGAVTVCIDRKVLSRPLTLVLAMIIRDGSTLSLPFLSLGTCAWDTLCKINQNCWEHPGIGKVWNYVPL